MNGFDMGQSNMRNDLQKEYMLCGDDMSALSGILRRTRELDMTENTAEYPRAVRLAPFIEELCLAASFYLLPSGKSIGLIDSVGDFTALLPVRKTERNFFSITSRLFKKNSRICARLVSSGNSAGLILETDCPFTKEAVKTAFLRDYSFLAERNGFTPILRFERTDLPPEGCPADFSLLLCDRMSELNKWYFDIE